MTVTLLQGDCTRVLRGLPAGEFQTCVTSPPYWKLRDYEIEGQFGLESTPAEYVAKLVAIMREVRRVLRDDGTLWLNLGDSYAAAGRHTASGKTAMVGNTRRGVANLGTTRVPPGLKPKDLIGIPWRVALALQDDGWWLRSDIIWHKPNCMPASVHDRPTVDFEHVFLLAKRARYYYDAEAIAEKAEGARGGAPRKIHEAKAQGEHGATSALYHAWQGAPTRNRRSVWRIPTRGYKGAHFAVFPSALVEPCIKAGTSARGACPTCGKAWERVVERKRHASLSSGEHHDPQGVGALRDENGTIHWGDQHPDKNPERWKP